MRAHWTDFSAPGFISGLIHEDSDFELEGFNPPAASSFMVGNSSLPSRRSEGNRRFSLGANISPRGGADFNPFEVSAQMRQNQRNYNSRMNRASIPYSRGTPSSLNSHSTTCNRSQIAGDTSPRQFTNSRAVSPTPPPNKSSLVNPSARFPPRASCRRENTVIREKLNEQLFSQSFAHSTSLIQSQQPNCSSKLNSSSQRPISALQASFERGQNNSCGPKSLPNASISPSNRLSPPSAFKFPANHQSTNNCQLQNASPTSQQQPRFQHAPNCSAIIPRSSTTCDTDERIKTDLPTLTTSVTTFMVPTSVGGEVCIRTPVQVEIVKSSSAEGIEKTLRQYRGMSQCPVHGGTERFNYTQYARVHDLNCSGVPAIKHGGGVPSLCGKCVPAAREANRRRSMSMAATTTTKSNFLQVPNHLTAHLFKPKQLGTSSSHEERSASECGGGVRRSYEEIRRECEEKAREKVDAIIREGMECKDERDNKMEREKEEQKAKLKCEGEKEKEKDKSNFLSIIKDFTSALGSFGDTEKSPSPPPPLPEIKISPPTPPLRSSTPIERVREEKEKETEDPKVETASAFGNFGRATVGSTPGIIHNQQAIPKIVISDWDVPKVVLEEGQQQRIGWQRPHTRITPSECGFCNKLPAMLQGNEGCGGKGE